MGGFGSGRGIRWNRKRKKEFVERYEFIDTRLFPYWRMKKLPDNGFQCLIQKMGFGIYKERLDIFMREGEQKIGYTIKFSLSRANYGNYRYWFICPNSQCGQRCRKLFQTKGSEGMLYFLCRHCLELVFRSQNRIELDRIIDRKWKLIHSLRCDSPWIQNSARPKGMHRRTFEKIREEIERLDDEADRRITALGFGCCF